MANLRIRFGRLVAAHRRRRRLTQEALAEAADLSLNMIAKIEAGSTGARFTVVERLADALQVDPAELFSTEIPAGAINRGTFAEIGSMLAPLPDADLALVHDLLKVALKSRSASAGARENPSRKRLTTKPIRKR